MEQFEIEECRKNRETRIEILSKMREIINKGKCRFLITGINPERLITPITKHSEGVWNSEKCAEIFLPWKEDYIEIWSKNPIYVEELISVLPKEICGRKVIRSV